MPSSFFAEHLTASVEPLVTTFLPPLFFVYSGLNTQISLVNSPTLWAVTLGILVVSIAGKGIACTVAARLNNVPFRESIALGSLMNARGLIELILLNIGLEAGIITRHAFQHFGAGSHCHHADGDTDIPIRLWAALRNRRAGTGRTHTCR
jgi:Kef-type K+ transport system membrane component KefB